MAKIVFGRAPSVYLPEIRAYMDYINTHVPGYDAYDSFEIQDYDPMDFDVVWRFMGFDIKGRGRTIIHEYNSLSTGLFAHLRNDAKRFLNKKPDGRVFLNRAVRKGFPFQDDVPHRLRDMGVDQQFFLKPNKKTEYDFVYAGSLDRGDIIFQTLDHFKHTLKHASVLIVGEVPKSIHERYGRVSNIIFTGRVPYKQVPQLMHKARFGLNLMPNIYPFNAQTATKVLEYCALGLPVISTDYKWVRRFTNKHDAKFFLLEDDFSNFTMDMIENYTFITPKVEQLEWNNLIRNSGVFDLLPDIQSASN